MESERLGETRSAPSLLPVAASSYNTGKKKKEKVERLAVANNGANMLQQCETGTLLPTLQHSALNSGHQMP